MSATEQQEAAPAGGGVVEETGRPSVRLTRNAKGDVQIDVKAYGASADELGLGEAGAAAQREFDRLALLYPIRRTP